MSAASLHLARWNASEVVLLDIGESLPLHALVLCATTLLQRERLRPAYNYAMHATVEWLVWPATVRSTADEKLHALVAMSVLLRVPGRLQLPSRHCDSSHPHVSTAPSNACNRYEAPC